MSPDESERVGRMELGAQMPIWFWGYDVSELRDWLQGAEAIGYQWLDMPDHVVYAYTLPDRPASRHNDGVPHHEIMTFLAYAAACTSNAALVASVVVAPQREPVLLAKQAAEVDVLSGGRLRLGLGMGWQEAEFEALGASLRQRPSRMEEAVAVMRACWSQEPIDFHGRYTTMRRMSMLPKPANATGPPILFGGTVSVALERAARLGDGWLAGMAFTPQMAPALVSELHGYLRANGREPHTFPLHATMALSGDLSALTERCSAFRAAGFTRLGMHIPSVDPSAKIGVDEYLRQLEAVHREVWPVVIAGAAEVQGDVRDNA
jgi:probable F420-dependent oxidoreductase